MEEHVNNDIDNEVSVEFDELVKRIYEIADKVQRSGPNRQELGRVLEMDPERVGKVVYDIKVPNTRWCYHDGRLSRNSRMIPYYEKMLVENMSFKTTADHAEWYRVLGEGQHAMTKIEKLIPILARITCSLKIFQSPGHPISSLVLYCAADLDEFADRVGDDADANSDDVVERIASRVAEIKSEFDMDCRNDMLKLCQSLDPRVSHRETDKDKVKRLLEHVRTFSNKNSQQGFNGSTSDGEDNDVYCCSDSD